MLVNQTTYDSFGQVLNETNSLLGDRFKFTGRELNSGSDYYYRARQYSASSGRFGSLDPIGFGGFDANLFRYVNNNSISFQDPSGTTAAVSNAIKLGVQGGLRGAVQGVGCGAASAFLGGGDFVAVVRNAAIGGLGGAVGGAGSAVFGRLAFSARIAEATPANTANIFRNANFLEELTAAGATSGGIAANGFSPDGLGAVFFLDVICNAAASRI